MYQMTEFLDPKQRRENNITTNQPETEEKQTHTKKRVTPKQNRDEKDTK